MLKTAIIDDSEISRGLLYAILIDNVLEVISQTNMPNANSNTSNS